MAESVLMVVVPEAEALVGSFRDRFDPSAAQGAPAHSTVLYPFLPPGRIDARVVAVLEGCCAKQAPIDFQLQEIRRFAPDPVLYLTPDPAAPFHRLTEAIWQLFPETPPYAGRHKEIVPHLSLAWVETVAALSAIEADFRAAASPHLPISARVTALELFDNVTGRWEQRRVFPFAA